MKIAVIGTGIAGMVAAHKLHRAHDLTVFEAGNYVGGHTATIPVEENGRTLPVDTGFIVYNEWTYPNFCALLSELGVATKPSDMSFSVRDERTGLEYAGNNLSTLFAQRRNLLRPSHYRMLADLLRFYRQSRELLRSDADTLTLGEYLQRRRYSQVFIEQHLIPMGAAIWSANPAQFYQFPARSFVAFCHNHGMLNLFRRPQWRVIQGGSWEYAKRLTAPFQDRIRLSTPVAGVRRSSTGVEVAPANGAAERFDAVVIATHSDQALRLLADASPEEQEILGAIPYQPNDVALHTDTAVLPRNRRAWASWNYQIPRAAVGRTTMTYNMNLLQSLDTEQTYCVTLNATEQIDPGRIIRRFTYDHPAYTVAGVAAQRRHAEINGVNRTYFCGAYWGYGFHEDGVKSGLAAVAPLLEQAPLPEMAAA